MRYTHVLLLLVVVGWLGSGHTGVWAQSTAPPPGAPLAGETALNPGEPPTPQFLRVAVEFGPDGLAFRMLYDPAWRALFRPQVRVGRARPEAATDEDTAPRLEGGPDQLQRTLEQALDRTPASTAPSP